jgi:hypothetical protein
MDEATKYKQYLKGLERIEAKTKLDKATKKVKDMLSAKAAEKESFVKRRMELAGKGALDYAKKAAKASKYGKIAGAVAAAGIAGSAFLRSKMKDIKEKQQAEGKMGGGMMYKYKSGGLSPKQKKIASMAPPPDRITGEDFQAMKIMKAKSGSMVHVKTKIGKNKPTKIY